MPPPLPPSHCGTPLSPKGKDIVVELFLDLVCPFSSKMYKVVFDEVLGSYGDKVSFVVHQVIQPWHPQGTYVHEAALAVRDACGADAYAKFVRASYGAYDDGKWKDDDSFDKTRGQIYAELCALAATIEGVDAEAVAAALKLTGPGNAGTGVTQAIKWAVKYHRCRGIHVTPTVLVNGLEAGIVSSSWTAAQWKAWLEPMGADNWQGSKLG